jgi:hypothetical protein
MNARRSKRQPAAPRKVVEQGRRAREASTAGRLWSEAGHLAGVALP